MASEYEALLEPPKEESEFAALLEPDQAVPAPTFNPRNEQISTAPTVTGELAAGNFGNAALVGAGNLSRTLEKLFAPGQESGARLISPEVADVAVKAASLSNPVGIMSRLLGGQTRDIVKAGEESLAANLSGVSSLEGIASLPSFAFKPAALAFAASVASKLPEQYGRLKETIEKNGLVSAETARVAADAGIQDLMGFLALKGGAKGKELIQPETPQTLSEALKPILEPAVARSEIPLAPEIPIPSEEIPASVPAGKLAELQLQAVDRQTPDQPIPAPEANLPANLDPVASPEAITTAPEIATPASERVAPAYQELQAAQASGDAARIQVAQQNLDSIAAELIAPREAKIAEAQANVTSSSEINPVRDVTPETVFHPADTEMAKQAAESLGLRYDGINEGFGGVKSQIQITNTENGQSYHMFEGETVADLQAKINEKAGLREAARPETASEFVGAENEPLAPAPVTTDVARSEGAAVAEPVTVGEPILSPGPGAAAAAEPLASYEQRRFGERFQEDASIDPAIREQTGNRYYEPISNKVTVAEAEGIIERRGTDESIRLVRDESFPMEPRVRVTVGEALIKKLNQSYQESVKAGDVRAPEFLEQAVDTAEYLSGYGTTLGQGVQAFAIWNKLTPEGRLMEATRMAQKSGVELKPEQIERINKLNEEIETAPEGFQKDEKTQDLLSYMSEIKGINPADVPTALWYSNILSGFSTQLVNTIDTGLNVLAESVAMAASHPSRVPEIVSGLYQGMIRGGFEAASVLKTGRSPTGDKISQQRVLERVKFGQEGGVPMTADTPIQRFMKRAFESKAATPLNLWKYPLRAMVASDTMFFNSFKEARARFLARGIAKTEGLTGDALFKRVEEALNQSPETLDAALKQAQDEGLTGLNQRRRVAEIVEQGRSDSLVGDANEAAAIATYNHDPAGVLGLVAQNIANITEGFPLGKAVVPFTRIVANVANRGLNYTPWGYKRLFFGEWGGKKFATEPPTGDAYRAQLVKATLGTTAMTAIALLDANDTIQVTAKGPENPEERKQLQNAGWKPYSVKVGDTYYSYQYTPFNLGFAMIGHYRDAVRYNKLSEKDAQTRLAYGMLKSGSTIFDMSFLSGISDFIETMQGATSSTKSAARLFSRTASSVLIPNLVKQTDKLFDPTIYQSDTITQSLIRETPIARSFLMKPMLNVLGEPVQPSQNRFFTFDTEDPVWKLIVEKQAWVPVPSKTSKIGDRPIRPDEYYRLIEESGPMIHEYIKSNIGKLRDMTGEKAQDDIQKESQRIRRVVKSRF